MGGPTLRAWVMGRCAVEIQGKLVQVATMRGRRQATDLLVYLLTRSKHSSSTDEAIEDLWPDRTATTSQQTLYRSASQLRTLVRADDDTAKPLVLVSGGRVALNPAWTIDVDLASFETALTAARREPDEEHCMAALALYGGELLADDRYASWIGPRRQEVERERGWLLSQVSRFALARGDFATLLESALAMVELEHWNEDAHRHVMQAYAGLGRRAEALRHYHQLASVMERTLNAKPSAATRGLFDRLSNEREAGEPTLESVSTHGSLDYAPDLLGLDPFVGRQRELTLLSRLLAQLPAQGSAVFIGGESGVGKTRLTRELCAIARQQGVEAAVVSCSPETDNAPYGPLSELIAAYLQASLPPTNGTSGADSGKGAAALLAGCEPLLLLVPELARTLGSHNRLLPDHEQRVIGQAFVSWLRLRARNSGFIVVLDDAQWADGQTVSIIRYLINQIATLPVLFVGIYREDAGQAAPLASFMADTVRKRQAQRFVLSRLGRGEVQELLHLMLDGPPSRDLVTAIYGATNGNPLFVEGIVQHLLQTEAVFMRDGLYHTAGTLTIPSELAATIRQRVDVLSMSAQHVVECAAVLGTHGDHFLLADMCGWDEQALLAAVDEARAMHILVDEGEGYAFRHGIVRDVVYRGLSAGRRMALHRKAAEAIEARPDRVKDDIDYRLAFHWSRAGDAHVKAAECHIRAAEHARRLGALEHALASHKEAIAQLKRAGIERGAVAAEALVGIAKAQAMAGAQTQSRTTMERALEAADDPTQQAYVYRLLGDMDARRGSYSAASERYRQGLDIVGPEPSGERLRLLLALEYANVALGRLLEAAPIRAAAAELEAHFQRPFDNASQLLTACRQAYQIGDLTASRSCASKSLTVARRSRDLGAQSRALHALGFLATQAGDLRAAQECLAEALELAQRTGYPSEQARALICLHTCYALAGEIDKATAANTEALGLAEFHELAGLSAECHLAYADRLITQGDLEGSSEHLRRARLFANQADDASCRIRIALGGARRAMTQGDYQEAAEELTAVLARYPMLDQSPEGLQGRGLLGVALFALAVPTGESMTEQALLACDQAGWVVGACIIRLMALLAAVHVEDSARIRAHHEAVVREAQTRGLQVIVTVARNLIDRPLRLPLPLRPGQAAAIV